MPWTEGGIGQQVQQQQWGGQGGANEVRHVKLCLQLYKVCPFRPVFGRSLVVLARIWGCDGHKALAHLCLVLNILGAQTPLPPRSIPPSASLPACPVSPPSPLLSSQVQDAIYLLDFHSVQGPSR